MANKTTTKYSPEVRERTVRLVFERQGEHAPQWTAIGSIAAEIGCTAEILRDPHNLGDEGGLSWFGARMRRLPG